MKILDFSLRPSLVTVTIWFGRYFSGFSPGLSILQGAVGDEISCAVDISRCKKSCQELRGAKWLATLGVGRGRVMVGMTGQQFLICVDFLSVISDPGPHWAQALLRC